jgi:hypothetical protein
MTVQDDERERELVRLFNLQWDADHQRSGADAFLDVQTANGVYRFEVEVKSTTTDTVSTARDVGMVHIEKWRKKIFIIGFYSRAAGRPELKTCLCLTPTDMEPWIASIEQKILPDFEIAKLASNNLAMNDMFAVCGKKRYYTTADAKRLHKMQWSKEQYAAAQDVMVGTTKKISPLKMLSIFCLRAQYIAERGATLNNPHIPKTHLSPFFDTDRQVKSNWAAKLQTIGKNFIVDNPAHPSAQKI